MSETNFLNSNMNTSSKGKCNKTCQSTQYLEETERLQLYVDFITTCCSEVDNAMNLKVNFFNVKKFLCLRVMA